MKIRPADTRHHFVDRPEGRRPGLTGRRSLEFLILSLGLASVASRPHPGRLGSPVESEVPGFAEIVAPMEGQALQGIVTIRGTASHPAFAAYELAFGLDPDPTDTWFPLTEPVDTAVVDGRLAIWDTGPISDGDYRLRLRVVLRSGTPLVAMVEDLRVRNYTPTEVPVGQAQIEPTPEPTAVEAVGAELPTQAEPARPDRFRSALTAGAAIGTLVPAVLALYVWLAPRARAYRGFLRMRRLHQHNDRNGRR